MVEIIPTNNLPTEILNKDGNWEKVSMIQIRDKVYVSMETFNEIKKRYDGDYEWVKRDIK